MPHVALVVAGAGLCAGLYAGYRWLSREVGRHGAGAARLHEMRRRTGEVGGTPKDLGRLEWDEVACVYRPARTERASS